MTLSRYRALRRAWALNPPTHVLLAAWVGFQPRKAEAVGDFSDLLAFLGVPT